MSLTQDIHSRPSLAAGAHCSGREGDSLMLEEVELMTLVDNNGLQAEESQRRHEEVQANLPSILGTNQQYPSNSGAYAKYKH